MFFYIIYVLDIIIVHELNLIMIQVFEIFKVILVFIYIHVLKNLYMTLQIKN